MHDSKIEWVLNPDNKTLGKIWNIITGCLNHVNGLCKGGNFPCYAYRLANGRLKERYLANKNVAPALKGYLPFINQLDDPFAPRFWESRVMDPVLREKPTGIFVCDMGELFGNWIPKKWQSTVFGAILICPQHWFYLLTKQPQNLIKFSPFPDNCFVGVSVTNNTQWLIAFEYLADIKAPIRFISFEPLLEWICDTHKLYGGMEYSKLNWVIIGGKSGSKKFYPPEEWIQEIERAADRAGIPVFEKDNLRERWDNLPRREFPKEQDKERR